MVLLPPVDGYFLWALPSSAACTNLSMFVHVTPLIDWQFFVVHQPFSHSGKIRSGDDYLRILLLCHCASFKLV